MMRMTTQSVKVEIAVSCLSENAQQIPRKYSQLVLSTRRRITFHRRQGGRWKELKPKYTQYIVERVRDARGRSAQTSGQKISSSRTAKSLAANVKTERNALSRYQVMRRLLVITRKWVSAGQTVVTSRLELAQVVWLKSSCPRGCKPCGLPYLHGLNCETRGTVSKLMSVIGHLSVLD